MFRKKLHDLLLLILLTGGFALNADDIYDNLARTPEAVLQWNNHRVMTLEPYGGKEGKSAVRITNTDPTQSVMASFPVELRRVRGKKIQFLADVKGESISKPEKPFMGVKMMIEVTNADGTKSFRDSRRVTGDFGWRELKSQITVPRDAVEVKLYIGLQNATGTVWYSDIELEEED